LNRLASTGSDDDNDGTIIHDAHTSSDSDEDTIGDIGGREEDTGLVNSLGITIDSRLLFYKFRTVKRCLEEHYIFWWLGFVIHFIVILLLLLYFLHEISLYAGMLDHKVLHHTISSLGRHTIADIAFLVIVLFSTFCFAKLDYIEYYDGYKTYPATVRNVLLTQKNHNNKNDGEEEHKADERAIVKHVFNGNDFFEAVCALHHNRSLLTTGGKKNKELEEIKTKQTFVETPDTEQRSRMPGMYTVSTSNIIPAQGKSARYSRQRRKCDMCGSQNSCDCWSLQVGIARLLAFEFSLPNFLLPHACKQC